MQGVLDKTWAFQTQPLNSWWSAALILPSQGSANPSFNTSPGYQGKLSNNVRVIPTQNKIIPRSSFNSTPGVGFCTSYELPETLQELVLISVNVNILMGEVCVW